MKSKLKNNPAELNDSIPVAPSLEPAIESLLASNTHPFGRRIIRISLISTLLGITAGYIARALTALIGLLTNLFFYGRWSFNFSSPAGNHLGWFIVLIPIAGAVIVGFMARYGSAGIRGHGIPEAMEQVILNESRIPPRLTFLKPLSAAISIGSGGPFGAEGPIIATGGALGSLIGQLIHTSASERKILLAAGAAGGMAATFGTPVASILLAVELLLFEFKPQSLIPVTLASASATAVRIYYIGATPLFTLNTLEQPGAYALLFYLLLGGVIGLASIAVTSSVYKIEDLFEKLPIHWMWWPAIGAAAVGVIGYFFPRTLGVGYDNIEIILSGRITGTALLILFIFKFVSWSISLGSGTSGGTLAPLFTIGGGLGSVFGTFGLLLFPTAGIDIRIAALVGMAALFAGSARALLTSIIFAFEITMQPEGLLPLLTGCSAAYLVSGLLMKHTIMTKKIARRGIKIPFEYEADFLDLVSVKDCAACNVVTINAADTIAEIRNWFGGGSPDSIHHGYPVLNESGSLVGLVSRKTLLDPSIPITSKVSDILSNKFAIIYPDSSLKQALDLMAETELNRLPVVERNEPGKLAGILSRSDILRVRRGYLKSKHKYERSLNPMHFIKHK